jgi:hypothetical protein
LARTAPRPARGAWRSASGWSDGEAPAGSELAATWSSPAAPPPAERAAAIAVVAVSAPVTARRHVLLLLLLSGLDVGFGRRSGSGLCSRFPLTRNPSLGDRTPQARVPDRSHCGVHATPGSDRAGPCLERPAAKLCRRRRTPLRASPQAWHAVRDTAAHLAHAAGATSSHVARPTRVGTVRYASSTTESSREIRCFRSGCNTARRSSPQST